MALLRSCFCCGLAIAAGFLAVYLVIAYMVAFGFELLWILESDTVLPTAAMLLCAGYFVVGLFAALLIHGIATVYNKFYPFHSFIIIIFISKMIRYLINIKNLLNSVEYLSLLNRYCIITKKIIKYYHPKVVSPKTGRIRRHRLELLLPTSKMEGPLKKSPCWRNRVGSLYGLTELTCWFARIISNVVEFILVQSLYSTWKQEELINKRLRDLHSTVVPLPRDSSLNLSTLGTVAYHNNGFDGSMDRIGSGIKRSMSNPQIWNGNLLNNAFMYQYGLSESEFNASTFSPSQMVHSDKQIKKAQSLIDFPTVDEIPIKENLKQQWQPWMSSTLETNSVIMPTYNTYSTYNPRMLAKCNMSVDVLKKYASMDALNDINRNHHIIRHRTGFYAQPLPDCDVPIYYGPLDGPDFLIYKKKMDKLTSKNSLSNTSTDDVQKYRDVAL
ncbi:uncharacterized protein LOC108735459 [Agrilus planipennis]|uniref:Uncharacterized protein LOC108735459 n=1 Tax=Agrilus planipennis TaxID=224129 RepID=A0A1W4WG39_AGRPL|nr:uncharacterized protein LOC108735459 [Agrilus planipennis]